MAVTADDVMIWPLCQTSCGLRPPPFGRAPRGWTMPCAPPTTFVSGGPPTASAPAERPVTVSAPIAMTSTASRPMVPLRGLLCRKFIKVFLPATGYA
jgi:hypothetical protein